MREVHRSQFQLGQVPVEKVWINPKSRDDIPAVLKGLQHIWCDEALRARLFVLLDEHILPEADRTVGRPGMDLWQILVLGVLKQGLGCDFDRLHDLTNHHQTIRAFLGHGDFDDKTRYEYQTVVDNVSLLTPELLSAVGRLVVESGHKVAKKKPGEPLRGRCDSFVVETDVHYPTDVSLLWDAVRCLLRETGLTAEQYAVRVRAHSRFPVEEFVAKDGLSGWGRLSRSSPRRGGCVLDITARTAHFRALKWTRATSTARAARSIFASFRSTCALPSGGRSSLRRVLEHPGRSEEAEQCEEQLRAFADEFFGGVLTPVLQRAVRSAAEGDAASALRCATCPDGCGATARRPSTFARAGARPCRSRLASYLPRETTPVVRSGGRDCYLRLGGAKASPTRSTPKPGLRCKPRGRHAQLELAEAAPAQLRSDGIVLDTQDPPLATTIATQRRPERPAERCVRSAGPSDTGSGWSSASTRPRPSEAQEAWHQAEEGAQPIPYTTARL